MFCVCSSNDRFQKKKVWSFLPIPRLLYREISLNIHINITICPVCIGQHSDSSQKMPEKSSSWSTISWVMCKIFFQIHLTLRPCPHNVLAWKHTLFVPFWPPTLRCFANKNEHFWKCTSMWIYLKMLFSRFSCVTQPKARWCMMVYHLVFATFKLSVCILQSAFL